MSRNIVLPAGGSGDCRTSPPAQRLQLLDRAALLDRLERNGDIAATIVAAPAGFGKSLLLAAWRDRQTKNGRPSAWLSLDETDQQPAGLARALATALGRAGIAELDIESLSRSETSQAFAINLVAALTRPGQEPLTLFLDRFERIAETPSAEWIADLLMRLAGRVCWVMATRLVRLSDFARLRVQGFLQILGDEDLRFTGREAASLLVRRLSAAEREMIEERLEGWPVAVQALAQEMATGLNVEGALSRLSGRRGMISDYVQSEIIAALPQELCEFLLDVSILPEIDAATADLVRERRDSHRMLTFLELLGSLMRERPHGRWRLHPLIREYLEAAFERQPEMDVVARRMAASNLLIARQDYAGAVRNALLAGRPREAVELIDGVGPVRLWTHLGLSYMRKVMMMLPPDLVVEYPAMRMGNVMILLCEGRVSSAANLIEEVRAAVEQELLDSVRLRDLHAEMAGVEVMISIIREYVSEETLAHLGAYSGADASRLSDELTMEAASLKVIAHQQWGELDEAERLIPFSQQMIRRWGSNFNEYFLEIYQGWIVQARGRPKEAIAHYRRALAIIGDVDDPGLRSLSEAMIAEALYVSGDFKGAAEQVDTWLMPLERSMAWYDYFAAFYSTAAALRLRSEGLNAALAMVERMRILALDRQAPSLLRLIPALKLSLLMRAGSWRAARVHAEEERVEEVCRAIPDDPRKTPWRERDLLRTAMAEFHIGTGNLAEARICVEHLAEDAAAGGRGAGALTANLFRAALMWRQGARGQAVALLAEAIEEVVASSQVGLLMTHVHMLEPLLKALRQAARAMRTAAARRLLNKLAADAATREAMRPSRLTPREHEVLTLVGTGDSNKRIARRLDVSENTVKFHLKRIAVKVDAVGSSRVSVVHAARRRGIFS